MCKFSMTFYITCFFYRFCLWISDFKGFVFILYMLGHIYLPYFIFFLNFFVIYFYSLSSFQLARLRFFFLVWNLSILFWRDTCTPMFIAALFTIAKIWKQPKYPSMDEQIKKMWYTHTHKYTHTHTQWNIQPQERRISCHLWQHSCT